MLLPVQRPPLWMFDALGILPGTNPHSLTTEIIPSADVIQGGMGQGIRRNFEIIPTPGAAFGPVTIVPADPKRATLIRCTIDAAAQSVAVLYRLITNSVGANAFRLWLHQANAGTQFPWYGSSGNSLGSGAHWLYVPADTRVDALASADPVGFGIWAFETISIPAGTKGW